MNRFAPRSALADPFTPRRLPARPDTERGRAAPRCCGTPRWESSRCRPRRYAGGLPRSLLAPSCSGTPGVCLTSSLMTPSVSSTPSAGRRCTAHGTFSCASTARPGRAAEYWGAALSGVGSVATNHRHPGPGQRVVRGAEPGLPRQPGRLCGWDQRLRSATPGAALRRGPGRAPGHCRGRPRPHPALLAVLLLGR